MMPVPGDHHRVSSPPKQQYSSDIHVYGGSEATKYAAALGDILEGLRHGTTSGLVIDVPLSVNSG